MSPDLAAQGSKAIAQISELQARRLTSEELKALEAVPVSDAEREEVLALVAWFRRRYPSPEERLDYVRRAYSRWTKGRAADLSGIERRRKA